MFGGVGVGPGTPPPPPPQLTVKTRIARQKSFLSVGLEIRVPAMRRMSKKHPTIAPAQSQEPGCKE